PLLYPLKFKPFYVKKIWSGTNLNKIFPNKNTPRKTGESWEIYDHAKSSSKIVNGELTDKTLRDVFSGFKHELLGDNAVKYKFFPLTIKYLDIQDKLSLQVHPGEEFIRKHGTVSCTKTECWYVINCDKETRVARGLLPGIQRDEFIQLLDKNTVLDALNIIKLDSGDIVYLPPGTLHTAWNNLVVLEVQNNCDVTFRLCDWDRKDLNGKKRKLDFESGMDCINFDSLGVIRVKPTIINAKPFIHKLLLKTESFTIESLSIKRGKSCILPISGTFRILSSVSASGKIKYGDKFQYTEMFDKGDTVLIPTCLVEVKIIGTSIGDVIISYC
ncbi:MAG: class I mannose-6-phosphate isomerase, partial [Planctomycetes bacterium]|nr:class I mannose-6-phosphate isomerase [Planctomycetota bacterium]